MNAYELAKKLKEDTCIQIGSLKPKELADVLIQMADRISVLEANHKIQLDINEKALQYIAELEKALESSIKLNKAQAERHKE